MIALIAAFAYGVESVFGFGGTLLFLAIGSSFAPFKTLLFFVSFTSITASAFILWQGYQSLHHRHIITIFCLSFPGMLLGIALIEMLETQLLLCCFALLLVIFGTYGLWQPHWRAPKWFSYSTIILGGVAQGLFATGGPIILLGCRDWFSNKQSLRASMALYFLLGNLWRGGQLWWQSSTEMTAALHYWPALPAILAGVWLGYRLHLRLHDTLFRQGLNALFILAGILLLGRAINAS